MTFTGYPPSCKSKIPSRATAAGFLPLLVVLISFLFLLAACTESRVEKLMAKANEEWIDGRNHSAIEIFKSVLEIAPSGPYVEEALFRLGEIYHFGLGDNTQAINYFQEVARMNKKGPFAYDARKYIAEMVEFTFKDYEQAIIEYQNLIYKYGDGSENGDHQYRIASIYYKIPNYEQALVELEILMENYPASQWVDEAQYKIIEIFYALDRCSESREQYQRFMSGNLKNPFKGEADFIMASCLEDEGKLEEALEIFSGLKGNYKYPDLLQVKLEGIKNRIAKK